MKIFHNAEVLIIQRSERPLERGCGTDLCAKYKIQSGWINVRKAIPNFPEALDKASDVGVDLDAIGNELAFDMANL
jgi:hypothetical protein